MAESWRVPTPVRELAAGMVEPPNRFVLWEQGRPGSLLHATDMPEPIPIVGYRTPTRLPSSSQRCRAGDSSWLPTMG
ncbi:unnamed protein product [Urochloa humidicola]